MSALVPDASDEPAGAADDSDVPAAAMLQARPFGSAGLLLKAPAPRPRSGIAGLPARGPRPVLAVADGSDCGSLVRAARWLCCPWRHML